MCQGGCRVSCVQTPGLMVQRARGVTQSDVFVPRRQTLLSDVPDLDVVADSRQVKEAVT